MIAGLTIRQADRDDAAVVAALLTELNLAVGAVGYPAPLDRSPEVAIVSVEQAAFRLQGTAGVEAVLLAELNGEPAGFTSLRLIPYLDQDTPYAEVTQLHVRPAFRRSGIARALVREAEERAEAAGATCVHILTGEDNPDAQAFYRSAGYETVCVEFQKFLPVPSKEGAARG
jgi:ribosomal protein S18 acetylase RimI-like enzyme